MTNNDFNQAAWEAFQEAATEKYDFATCQRDNGSYYGTGGTCRLGADVPGGVPKKEKAAKSSGGGGGGASKADITSKKKEVREMDKTAKTADRAADKADKKFQKSKSPEDQKEARRLDKIAKSANKEADKGQKELERMSKSATSAKGRADNVAVNKAISNVTQDGPKPTGAERQQAMKVLRQERARLESMEDNGKLSKAGEARLKLVKASQREYEIQGKQRSIAQTSDKGVARRDAKASGEVADRKAAARKENEAKKEANPRTDSKMSSAQAAKVKAQFDRKRQMERGGQDGPKATGAQRRSAKKNFQGIVNRLEDKLESGGKLTESEQAQLNLARASVKANS